MTDKTECPRCGNDLRGEPIPPEHLHHFGATHFVRTLGVEIRGVYDGVLFYQCPDCHWRWHRWPIGSDLHRKAERYVRGTP